MTELMMAKALGCREGDIMFSSNDTPEEEFRYADEIGGIINLDDITHIDAVERAAGRIPKPSAVVTIRAVCSRSAMILWIIPGIPSME